MLVSQMWYLHCRCKVPLQAIAKMTESSKSSVTRRIRAYQTRRGKVDVSLTWLTKQYNAGKSVRQIADAAFCDQGVILNRLHQYGFPVRKRGNPNWTTK